MKITEAELGRVKAELQFKKEFTNIYGDLHGGVLNSAVDTICGIAAGTYGYYVTTVDGQIRYLKAARATEYVTCIFYPLFVPILCSFMFFVNETIYLTFRIAKSPSYDVIYFVWCILRIFLTIHLRIKEVSLWIQRNNFMKHSLRP